LIGQITVGAIPRPVSRRDLSVATAVSQETIYV
jgi:hypothetical protein